MSSDPSTHPGRQAVDTGRRTNKFTKSREKVWPEELEKALLEGKFKSSLYLIFINCVAALAEYRPTSAKDPRRLQRFPRRNRYIADKILEKTGCKRTPKQVGSRLQQLRETCSDPYGLSFLFIGGNELKPFMFMSQYFISSGAKILETSRQLLMTRVPPPRRISRLWANGAFLSTLRVVHLRSITGHCPGFPPCPLNSLRTARHHRQLPYLVTPSYQSWMFPSFFPTLISALLPPMPIHPLLSILMNML